MNFVDLVNKPIIGQFMRFPLRFIPKKIRLPIIRGSLKGKKWIVGSSNHGCWIGIYEYQKQHIFERTITQGSIVYDLGAHVGFYTLLASVLVGSGGKVVSFEPIPRNIFFLKEHLRLNQIDNVQVVEAAVSNKSGITFFDECPFSMMSHISTKGKLQVKTVAIDDLISEGEIPPADYIKIDIEGAEMLALSGAKFMISRSTPTIFLATHGKSVHQECCQFLRALDYKLKPIDNKGIEESSEIVATYTQKY